MADRIKIDFEEDDNEELIDFNLVEAAEEFLFATAGDPLLELTPIVYTTKLDDMQTVKQDHTGLDASEILRKLHSESRPVINYSSVKKRKLNSRCPSFMRVSRVVSDINSKASKRRKIIEKSDRSYDSSQQHERCKPCTVMLKNIGWLVKNQQTIKVPISKIALPKILQKPSVEITLEELTPENNNNRVNDNIRQTAIKEEIEISVPNKSENGVEIAEDPLKVEHIEIDIEPPENNKNVANKIEKVQGSKGQRGRQKKRPRYICEDSDDDDIPLQAVKKAKLPSSRSSTPTPAVVETNIDRTNGHSQHASRIVTDMVYTPQEKYFLIVLTNKNDESTIYRINATKFVTDYYMTRQNKTDMANELVLASLFPREEKIIDNYCCWYRREDIVSKICSRKNFPFIIQKFLKQPHGCITEDCECCCRIELQQDNTKSNQSWREVVEHNLEDTDAWMKQLLGINASNSDRLLSKTFNYIPKSQKIVEKKTRETQLNNILLCIENYKNVIKDNLSEFELYYIENNGDVQRTLFSNDREQVQLYRKSYQPILESKGEIKNALICCWYKREKLMLDLKKLKASPAALRHIQKPHRCARNICSCCCKQTPLKLTGGNIVPPTLHHTALYEKSDQIVEINFNKTKSQHCRIRNDVKSQLPNKATKAKGTNTTVAAVILSDCALKEDNLSPSIYSIDKFHTLKLDVSQYGTLEVILDAPAKTLSVQDLKVISNTITLATNKMSELKLTAEEFCTRVNSKSTKPVQIKDFEATILRSVESASTEDTADNSDHYDNNDHMDYDDTEIVNTNVKVVAKPTTSHSTITNKGPSTSSTPKVTHVSIPILQKPTNPKAGLLSALSGLLQTKSKCYVDSFKSFFKNSARSKETPEGSQKSAAQGMQKYYKKAQNDLISLPVIAETFTLKHSSETKPPEARVGSKIYSGKAVLSINNTQMNGLANSVDSTVKLRVKPVSELIASDAPTTDIGNVQGSSSDWAVPIVRNVKPPIAAQKKKSNMAATVGPDIQSPTIPTFLIPQNVPIGTTFKLVRKPLSYAPNDSKTMTSINKNGAHVLTLMPIGGQPSNEIVPGLVPFRPPSATQFSAPTKVYINKMTSSNTNRQTNTKKQI